MARRVFFSFHHRDLWRANVVRNSGVVEGVSPAGFQDAAIWDDAKKMGDVEIKKLIDRALDCTSVTVVLISAHTAHQTYLSYEIDRSIARGNGLFGIRIETIKNQLGVTDARGPVPASLTRVGAPIYDWEYGRLGRWVEVAYDQARRRS
jgi:hypothetical protein